jgi:hypothetical protein
VSREPYNESIVPPYLVNSSVKLFVSVTISLTFDFKDSKSPPIPASEAIAST